MLSRCKRLRLSSLLALIVVFAFCCAFVRVHLRVQTTLIGYDIGKLKEYEATLLKKRSLLTMELAKMTSKQHLQEVIAKQSDGYEDKKTLAARL